MDSTPPLRADFAESMRELLGDSFDPFVEAMSQPPQTSVKLNLRKLAGKDPAEFAKSHFADCHVTGVEWCASGFYLEPRPNFTLDPLLHAGIYYVQDASSMVYETIVANLLKSDGNLSADNSILHVLDMCAAPGGKTTSIINALPDRSVVVANEYVRQRAAILRENLCKWGYPDVIVTNCATEALARSRARFDIVAVDAPCSGEGMMRKDDDAVNQWSRQLIESCARLQREILGNAAAVLRPGGYLIYSTCTFNRSEDEENVKYLVENLGLEPIDTGLVGQGGISAGIDSPYPCLRFMPHLTRGEGLFAAVFRKSEAANATETCNRHRQVRVRSQKKPKSNAPEISGDLNRRLIDGSAYTASVVGSALYMRTAECENMLASFDADTHVIMSGVEAGEIKGNDIVPTSILTLSTAYNTESFPVYEADLNTALHYLAKETIVVPPDMPRGFIVINYAGYPLGVVKNVGNRANNLYPSNWRIRQRL